MGRIAGKPAYVWLWYADGSAIPTFSQYCGDLTPPAYHCNFGASLEDCQRQVQVILDAWYKDFNLVFTLTRPPTGDFYTIVVTSSWPQCQAEAADLTGGVASGEGGLAPGNCSDNPGQAALAIECGKNAHDCATIIAHEHGHLVGLVHTTNVTDVMYPSVRSTAAGFVNETMTAVQDASNTCQVAKQSSYQQMLTALGAWPGGSKPAVFTEPADAGGDAGPPDAAVDATSGGAVGPSPTNDNIDGDATYIGGADALVRPTIPRADAATTSGTHGGCALGDGHGSLPSMALVVLTFLVLTLQSRARAWRLAKSRRSRR